MPHYLRTLGALSLHEDAGAGTDAEPVLSNSKSLALLAYVALAPGRRVRRSHLARLLWPESDTTLARRSLRQALYYLTKRADGELLRSADDSIAVLEERVEVDAWQLDRALREGRLADAVDLYGGNFLGAYPSRVGHEFESWAETQNERIWSGVKAACHELVVGSIEAGDFDRAVRYGRDYVALNPLDETAQTTLVRALLANGERVAAYRQYETYRTLLEEELGERPDAAFTERILELRDEIFAGSGEEAVEDAAVAASRAPSRDAAGGAAGGDRDGAAGLRPLGWALAGALVSALAFVAVIAAGWQPGDDPEGPAGWEGTEGTVTLYHGPEGRRRTDVRIEDGLVTLRPSDLSDDALVSPRGGLLARSVKTDSGPDVIVTDRSTGDTVAAVETRADEAALAWAPDGSRLLVARGQRLEDDRDYRRVLHVLSIGEGSVQPLDGQSIARSDPSSRWAVWSPLGDRIAYVGEGRRGDPDVRVMDSDGSHDRLLAEHPGRDLTPAWSPDGRRIAFASDRSGNLDLWLVSSHGGGPERLTFGSDDEVAPSWLGPERLAFLTLSDGQGELWLLDLRSRATRRAAGPLTGLEFRRPPTSSPGEGWIEELRIQGGDRTTTSGQRIRFRATGISRAGDTLPDGGAAIRWTSLAPDVVRIDREDDGGGERRGSAVFVARRTGSSHVVASAGGWRADTVSVRVGWTRMEAGTPSLLEEDWSRGIDDSRWRAYGEPGPRVVRREADEADPGFRRFFDPNGDANYSSGVVSRASFPLAGGLTLEFECAVPPSDRLYEQVVVGLDVAGARDSADWARRGRVDVAEVNLRADRRHPALELGGETHVVRSADVEGARHRHALQIGRDGRVSYAMDGRLLWQSSEKLSEELLDARAVVRVAGRSLRTDVRIGTVRLWRGVRYTIAAPDARTFRLSRPPQARGDDGAPETPDRDLP